MAGAFTFGSTKQPQTPVSSEKGQANGQPSTSASSKPGPSSRTHVIPNGQNGTTEGSGHNDSATNTPTSPIAYLEPSAFSRKGKGKWVEGGRTMAVASAPVGGEVAAWVTTKPSSDPNKADKLSDPTSSLSDQTIYFASPTSLPDAVLNFYTETYTLFTSLQRIVASAIRLPISSNRIDAKGFGMAEAWDKQGQLVGLESLLGPPGAETVGHMRRLVGMYLEEIMRLRETTELETEAKVKWTAVYHIFQLSQILYLPQDGRGEGLLGEELLDWVNDVDPQPDNSVGTSIMSSRDPWTHPSFWPYITRCLLRGFHLPASSFLRTLSSHPHPHISKIGILLATHLSLLPRSHNTTSYPLDHQFLSAHKMWLARFRAELGAATGGKSIGKWLEESGGIANAGGWERDLKTVVELMEGKKESVLDEAADWREAVGAWGILVDVGLRRDDLPSAMKKILAGVPAEMSILDDSIQSNLCRGEIIPALQGCHDMDSWLAAHLGDIFDKLALIPDDEERFDSSLRDYFLLDYTDTLSGNPKHAALWRICADYLNAAGEEGRIRLKSHILHTALGLDWQEKGKEKEVEGMKVEDKGDKRFEHFTEIRECCVELRLEEEWKVISKVMADRLVRRGEFGLGATMCLQAEDGEGLSRIAEKIVDLYIDVGEEEFLRVVDTLPTSLLNEAPQALHQLQQEGAFDLPFDLTSASAVSIFASRLAFLSELRDYLLYTSQNAKDRAAQKLVGLLSSGIAPVGIWAILLVESVELLEDTDILLSSHDTFELMRIMEEITSNARFNPDDFLGPLSTLLRRRAKESGSGQSTMRDKWAEAWRKLEEVRLALARNLARALVAGFDNPF